MFQNQQEAFQYLAQLAQDFINTLPPSANAATSHVAQQAIQIVGIALQPQPGDAPADKPAKPARKPRKTTTEDTSNAHAP